MKNIPLVVLLLSLGVSFASARTNDLSEGEIIKAIRQWERVVNGECDGVRSDKCANALQQLGHYNFLLEESRGSKNHSKSLSYFLEYIDKYPKSSKLPVVLYQTAAIQEGSGEKEKALKLRERLVRTFPNDRLAPKAWHRIAEYHFTSHNFKNAIAAYKKIDGFENFTGKEGALAVIHWAEALDAIEDYENAAYKYFSYIVGADKGRYANELRDEAMEAMISCFAKLDNGADLAESFLTKKKAPFRAAVVQRLRGNGGTGMSRSGNTSVAGKLVDKRDGETYRTVRIGDREWMAENLRFASPKSICLNNDPSQCRQGRFYSISERHGVCPEGWKLPTLPEVVCVMTKEGKCVELYDGQKSLAIAVNEMYGDENVGTLLKTRSQWKQKEGVAVGTDKLNFSAAPMGFYKDSEFQDFGGGAYFWTLTPDKGSMMIASPDVHMLGGEPNENSYYYWAFYYDSEDMVVNTIDNSTYFSVRCVKNAQSGSGASENKNASPAAQGSAPEAQNEGIHTYKVFSDHPGGSAPNKNGYR